MPAFRPATDSDSAALFAWRNDPITRQNSRNTDPVSREDHCRWLAVSLAREDRELWIAEADGEPVGVVRYDLGPKNVELSWTVAPEARGRGHGRAMVAAAMRHRRWPLRSVVAEVKPENGASLAIARHAGLIPAGEHDGLEVWCEARPAPYVIAELSGNHNGSLERAIALIDAAKAAGADAVKLQTYTPDSMTLDHEGPGFVIEGGLWGGRTLYDLYREAATPIEWHAALFGHARKIGITCFSSPFDADAVDLLESLGAPAYKIASFELVDTPLIRKVAATGKPIILSTGMASDEEIAEAVEVARGVPHALLHCVSAYPAPAESMNLWRLSTLAAAFDCPIGLSDHSLGDEVAIAAVALGAGIIEKHLTFSRADGGPDAGFSLEPDEFARMSEAMRRAHAALGRSADAEDQTRNRMLRRSLYVVRDMQAGEAVSDENVRSIRPGHGLPPKHLPDVIGRRVKRDVKRGTPLSFDLLE